MSGRIPPGWRYIVAGFKDGLDLIVFPWLLDEGKRAWYPMIPLGSNFNRAVRDCIAPNEPQSDITWEQHDILKIYAHSGM